MRDLFPELLVVIDSMCSEDPNLRPTVTQALVAVQGYHRGLSHSQLEEQIPIFHPPSHDMGAIVKATTEHHE